MLKLQWFIVEMSRIVSVKLPMSPRCVCYAQQFGDIASWPPGGQGGNGLSTTNLTLWYWYQNQWNGHITIIWIFKNFSRAKKMNKINSWVFFVCDASHLKCISFCQKFIFQYCYGLVKWGLMLAAWTAFPKEIGNHFGVNQVSHRAYLREVITPTTDQTFSGKQLELPGQWTIRLFI